MYRFVDIGANLTDKVFRGIYRGKKVHSDDYNQILERAINYGVSKIMITSGCKADIEEALQLVKEHGNLFTTVGVHPTKCNEFDDEKFGGPSSYLQMLRDFINQNGDKVVALGELGLDYDRTQFCSVEVQKKYFELQLDLAEETKLPLFLHSRNCADDFIEILERNRHKIIKGGVVHSFTGTIEEANKYIDLGFYIGINGCSLKTEENLSVMASIPSSKLMIETDAPWCGIRNTHAGAKFIETKFESKKKEKWAEGCTVKDRNEPCHIIQVLDVMSSYRKEDKETLAKIIYENTLQLFFPTE